MLFNPQAESLTQQAYKMAVSQSDAARKADAAKKLDLYSGAQVEHVLDNIRKRHVSIEGKDPVFVNVVKKIVNLTARVYLQDAVRDVQGTDQDRGIYAEIESTANLPVKMKLADRFSKLLGTILLRPLWRNGGPDIDILTPDVLNVVTGESPEDLRAVLITHASLSGRPDLIEFSLWTPETIERLNSQGKVIHSEANPYGLLPFVVVASEALTDSFWLEGTSDLVAAQDAINQRLTGLFYTLAFQGHGVGYIKGAAFDDPKAAIESGPNTMISLPEKGEVGFVAPNAPAADTIAAIEMLIRQTAVCNGLPAASLSTEVKAESGAAKLVGNAELEEQRRDAMAIFARVEDQLFHLWKVIWNYHNPARQISSASTLRIDFYDPKPVVSGIDQLREMQLRVDLGLADRAACLCELNPDLTLEDAEKLLARYAANNAAFDKMVAPQYNPMLFSNFEDQQ